MARRYRGSLRQRMPSALRRRPSRQRLLNNPRIIIALGMAAFAFVSFLGSKEYNPVTGETQYIALAPHQEIAMGLQAAPKIIAQHGGLYQSQRDQQIVDRIGQMIVQKSKAAETDWEFEFHLLADDQTVNAFALPGGQIFITKALYDRLGTEGQVAGVLGHEVGHVVARHSSQQMAKSSLTQWLTNAVMTASGTQESGRMAQMVGQMVNMKYGREDELQSDHLGVSFMADAGYDPRSMIEVMKVLAEASGAGGSQQPEFFSTHPNPDNRIEKIQAAIEQVFPGGVPQGLER